MSVLGRLVGTGTFALALVLGITDSAVAQGVTTAGIAGVITREGGGPIEGAVITLINVGKHDEKINPKLSPDQAAGEAVRPPRLQDRLQLPAPDRCRPAGRHLVSRSGGTPPVSRVFGTSRRPGTDGRPASDG